MRHRAPVGACTVPSTEARVARWSGRTIRHALEELIFFWREILREESQLAERPRVLGRERES